MNYFLKYRFAIWSIIILSVIILSSVSTLFVLKLSHKNDGPNRFAQIGKFFKEELKLTADQESRLRLSRRQYFQNTKSIFDSLENKRLLIIQELCKPIPDSTVLYKLCDDIGLLHANLKHESIKNLLVLRGICTPEQVQKLNTINEELVGPEGPMRNMRPHKGKKPGEVKKPN